MTLNLNVPTPKSEFTPRITVIGVGGAGGNAVNNMIQANLEGVDFLIANTDAQAMDQSLCNRAVQLGRNITQGLGAGSRPDIGRAAAEEAVDEILDELMGTNMVFVTAGMGGGTGTGAAPVLARAAREAGILTVGVVTKPFHFEGIQRMRLAEAGIQELTQYVDTLIIIPNQNLFRVANEKTTFADAFKMADDVLRSGVRGVTDLMVMPGLINLDFADIRSVMTEMGKAMMGTGEAEGPDRALAAAEAAISNPLLDDVSMKGARGVLINITGGHDLTLFEVDETANRIRDEVDPDANIIFGSTFDQSLEGTMRVSVVATGIEVEAETEPRPVTLSVISANARRQEPAPEEAEEAAEEAAEARMEAPAEAIAAEEVPEAALRRSPMAAQGGDTARATPAPAPVLTKSPQPRSGDLRAAAMARHDQSAGQRSARESAASGDQRFDRKRAQGLFAKVTGAARAFQAATQGSEPGESQAIRPAAASAPGRLAPTAERRPLPARERNEERERAEEARQTPTRGAAQPRLAGLDQGKAAVESQGEDDLLEIPAFLRRQAN